MVTPLGSYTKLFGEGASGKENTLKVKVSYWQQGMVKYLEFLQDCAVGFERGRALITGGKPRCTNRWAEGLGADRA